MTINDLDVVVELPGVYFWLDKNGEIIYIGKAKNLKKRMKQYFLGSLNSYKTSKLVEEIFSFEFVTFNNEKEALIYEQLSIAKHRPKYNILLLDDKKYPYLKISLTNKITIQRVWKYKKEANSIYYGPLPVGYGATDLKKYLESKILYRDGFLIEEETQEYWNKSFEKIKEILLFKDKNFINELTNQMNLSAKSFQFEEALMYKRLIETVSKIQQKQLIELQNYENVDIFYFETFGDYIVSGIATYRFGTLLNSQTQAINIVFSAEETINSFLNIYYSKNEIPKLIIMNQELSQSHFDIVSTIKTSFPTKGQFFDILQTLKTNVDSKKDIEIQKLNNFETKTIANIKKLEDILNINNASDIVIFDNSHFSNTNPVCAVLRIWEGQLFKSQNRRFNLEVKQDRKADVEYMKQAVTKFISQEKDKKPSLIIIDGGLAHINEVKRILRVHDWNVDLIGLVKNDNHKTDHIVNSEGKKIPIKDKDLYNFLANIQEEVDRNAKRFQAKKSLSKSLETSLVSIDGIGFKTEEKLLEKFGSYSAIYNASEEELKEVVSEKIAKKIKNLFSV
ncbi:GIY-YIG nuclease family protein [[Mycoplasma] gypis]|uniref:GIY-YIG nuclease family protein n=1 Tax=[Mycoplasma] gypis TaxID=92404 RepID=A0ABZ2RQ50_9BACT|nr:GIY-YIG nuclease family protein [[Mycoplasma] gypis]MBN0919336.1 GIY-YIG nuclease family protein [[Mycoplasma] gypis]